MDKEWNKNIFIATLIVLVNQGIMLEEMKVNVQLDQENYEGEDDDQEIFLCSKLLLIKFIKMFWA